MDPQHGATDFEPGRVSRLYQKLADQVEQLPNERRQELADLVNAQAQDLAELDQRHQQLLTRGVIAMTDEITKSDADTTANAGELWKLVRMVQDTINKDGTPRTPNLEKALAKIRKQADECDPEYGRF